MPHKQLQQHCSHGGLPPLSLALALQTSLVMWTKTKLISLRCPQRPAAPSQQVCHQHGGAGSQSLTLQSCPRKSQLSTAEEHKLGIPCPALQDRSWQPCQAQQKVASGCRDAWRGACGGLAAPHEHLELFMDFPLSKSGLGSGRKW